MFNTSTFENLPKANTIEVIKTLPAEIPKIFIIQNEDAFFQLIKTIKQLSISKIPYQIISMDEAVSLYLNKEGIKYFSFLEFLSGIDITKYMEFSSDISCKWFLKGNEDRTVYKGVSLGLLCAPKMYHDLMAFLFSWTIVNNVLKKFKRGIFIFSQKMNQDDFIVLDLFSKNLEKKRILIYINNDNKVSCLEFLKKSCKLIFNKTVSSLHYLFHETMQRLLPNFNSKRILIASPSTVNYIGGVPFFKNLTSNKMTIKVKNAAGLTHLYFKIGIIEERKIFDHINFNRQKETMIFNLNDFDEISKVLKIPKSTICDFIKYKYESDLLKSAILVEKSLDIINRWPFHLLLTHSDVALIERTIVLTAKSKGIPTFLVQHGINSWKIGATFLVADYEAVWGKVSYDWVLKHKSNTKPLLAGAPRYEKLEKKGFIKVKGKKNRLKILFALSQSGPTCRYGYMTYIHPWLIDKITAVNDLVDVSREIPDIEFIVKMKYTALNHKELFLDAISKGSKNICLLTNNKKFKEIIRESFIVIVDVSEVGLEAMHNEVPVIRYLRLNRNAKKNWKEIIDRGLRNEKDYVADGPKEFNAMIEPMNKGDLKKAILRLKDDPDYYKRQVQNGLNFVQSYCPKMNIEPSVAMAKEINKIISLKCNNNIEN
tara:strand:- start:4177 stop:6141 length:1965 start_codon:yes stop_codon:yes gene_type:complete